MTGQRSLRLGLVLPLLAAALGAQAFVDVTTAAGLGTFYLPNPTDMPTPRQMAGGIAVFDYDGDGWDDIFWPAGSLQQAKLFHNDGDGTFTDVAVAAGVNVVAPICSPAFADYDGDGDFDLFATTYENYEFNGGPTEYRNFLWRNNGNGTFTDVTIAAGLKQSGRWGASFGLLDKGQTLDLVTVSWTGDVTHIYRNNGNGTFTDLTPPSIINDAINGFAPTIIDYDDDGDMDILSANDFESTRIWRNEGNFVFTDVTTAAGVIDIGCCDMGSTFTDYDHDGDVDWFITDVFADTNIPIGWVDNKDGSRFWENNGNGTFTNVIGSLGDILDPGWGWGAQFCDLDNNTTIDVVHVNGFQLEPWQPALSYLKNDTLRIFLQGAESGLFTDNAIGLGINDIDQGRGCVVFDYDRDGRQDILVSNNDTGLTLYRNTYASAGRFVEVGLEGLLSNTHGIGAKVTLEGAGLPTQARWITHGCNFVSQSPPRAWFGVGATLGGLTITVDWPTGLKSVVENVRSGRRLTIREPLVGKVPGP